MAIKNKDGTVYKISGPNPLMSDQDLWKGFIKHNFEWTEEIDKDNNIKNIDLSEKEIDASKEVIECEVPKEIKVEKPIASEDRLKKTKSISDHKTIQCFCLPAKIIEKKDSLYEESYQKTEYLDKFLFETVIIEKEDIYIKFWTTEEINKNSIVYPKNKDKRWWKISEKLDAPMGFIYTAYPSDYTPSFE